MSPFEAGSCTFCHDAHGARRPKLLRQDVALGCLSCHAELQRRIRRAAVLHGPVRSGSCLECHRPHAAAGKKLLAVEPPRLCGGCHFLAGEAMGKAHPGLALPDSRCTSCHDPHVLRDAPVPR